MKNIVLLLLVLCLSCQFQTKGSEGEVPADTLLVDMSEPERVQLSTIEAGDFLMKDETAFGEVIELKGENLVPDTFIWRTLQSMMVWKGSKAVVSNNDFRGGSRPFIMFEYPSMRFIRKIGTIGNGPNEFMVTQVVPATDDSLLCYLYEETKDKLYECDFEGNFKLYPYPFDSSIKQGFSTKSDIYNVGKDDFFYVNDSKTGKSIFRSTMNGDSMSVQELYSLQLNPKRKSPFAYIGSFAVNLDRNRMFYAYKYFRILRFMDLEGNDVRTLNFQQTEFDYGSLKIADGLDRNITYYWERPAVTDKYIYILYSGRTPADAVRESSKGNIYIYLEQYDWNGNPIKKYRLDRWGYVYLDEQRNEIIMLSTWDDDPFWRYKFPDN